MASRDNVKCHPSWTQTGPSTYSQPYGFQEVLYNAISVTPGSPGLFLIATSATFRYIPSSPDQRVSSHDLVPRLRDAWIQLRQKYPGLAAENRPDGKFYKSPSSPSDLKDWLDTTFIVTRGKTSAEHWKTMVKARQMTLNYFPEEGQLFIQGEHHILDGRGVMNIWDPLASPTTEALMRADGSEVARLPPRSDDLLNMAEKEPGRGEQRAQEILAPLASIQKPIFIPVTQPLPVCSLRNSVLELKASPRITESIISECKAQHLSVTASWHAAVVLATQSVQRQRNLATGAEVGTEFATFGNFDLRRYFPSPDAASPPDAYALGNHHCVLPYVMAPDDKTFAQISKELASYYQQDLPKADPEIWSAMGPMIRAVLPDFVRPQLEETTPAVSSFGVVDNFISSSYTDVDGKGAWRIDDVWFGDTVHGPWLECFLWSWKGRLSLNTCYNSAYYNHAEVDDFNQLVLDKMLEGLGIGVRGQAPKL
ncbi:unnamed protein product [Clonostachys rosea]|uniref:Condensation domain-containing protein n=1 Tax=Bionectria ochroleuca TaxID=29856 RepID=A0ABY6U0J5_BIOOC|nr:unnamed protein product [Clonostachys rosea]